MKLIFIIFLYIIGTSLSVSANALSKVEDNPLDAIRAQIGQLVERGETPSLAAPAVSNGRTIWAEEFGMADLGNATPATAYIPDKLASISKSLTATTLMILNERGLVRLDTTNRCYSNLVTAASERYQYSNLGYGILGYVFSRVSRIGYPDFMDEGVFKPQGMAHRSVYTSHGIDNGIAVNYTSDGMAIPRLLHAVRVQLLLPAVLTI